MRPGHISDEPLRSEAEQRTFFEAALERSLEAESRTGVRVHDIAVAGTVIRLVFAGDTLERAFMPALAHLAAADDPAPDVTFHVWDSETTGVRMADPICRRECFTQRGDIWGLASERIRSAFHWVEGSVNLLDLERGIGMAYVSAERAEPGTHFEIDVRGTTRPAVVERKPLYRKGP